MRIDLLESGAVVLTPQDRLETEILLDIADLHGKAMGLYPVANNHEGLRLVPFRISVLEENLGKPIPMK